MESICNEQNEIIIGEKESNYIRESFSTDFLADLNDLEFALYRISKATKDIVLKGHSKYAIKSKALNQIKSGEIIYEQIKLGEINFMTKQFNKTSILYENIIYII